MRIAQIMLAKGFGGAERSFVDLTRALAERGHRVLAIGEVRGRALPMLAGRDNIECVAIRCLGSWDRLAEWTIRRHLARFAPVVVQAHLARAAHLGGRAACALGLPTVAKTHDLVDLAYYRCIGRLVPTTTAQAEYLRAEGVPAEAIERIPNFSPIRPVAGIEVPESQPHVIKALGRFVHKKGFDTLVDALARVRAAGIDARLVIGGDGPERGALEARIAALGLGGEIALPGWIEDVAVFLADAQIFVLPSRDEPFGIVVLEAMARGVPIVTTPADGPREVLDGVAWFSADAGAPALADAVVQALRDRPTTLAFASAALRRFNERYSATQVVARYLDLYARLLGDEPLRREP
jgi:glycosyltransferase involved in cell wall biosynthesis